ncbi:membrane protein insertase YidC [Desulfopila aestuarii]|uniref:Membrane protein insertase YidC n=1 Tax=Desulfopila aestuarii DSM 18488 TaxID=1121416 RepID=A0A1M7Y2E0_9BACT|nr:membrane protein insertase YidC [Desulfopila aestuarii]SHO46118.1 protein translocase subunit yidC [Desulfopila aestuarii DSM 18488]
MDTYRAFLAVIISFAILLGYQYFFVGFETPEAPVENPTATSTPQATDGQPVPGAVQAVVPQIAAAAPAVLHPDATDISVETDRYTAVFSENGGALIQLVLKGQKETSAKDSPGKELVNSDVNLGFPLKFSWGSIIGQDLFYKSTAKNVTFTDGKGVLTMEADAGNGLTVVRTYTFAKDSYVIGLDITVKNSSGQSLQGMAQLHQVNTPFQKTGGPGNMYLFQGSEAYINGELHEIKAKEYEDGPVTLQGNVEWAGFGGNYFLRGIVPIDGAGVSYVMQGNDELTRTALIGNLDTLQPGSEKTYAYKIYYGPKKVELLRELGYNLERSVNFGWFDIIARPTLWLLNFLYGFVGNYGVAIILVTIMFKAAFWPISQKGMKSMKNMQKLQPKMAKLKEKYKDDPTRMNQEVMNLYKTYRVNPLGGCLPMVLQIPVFFALYKVLLQSIELRHAPFMLWITDLSAPDRLWIGFDLPYLGGLPVLTLLMGASMWLQQKMTPTTADPTQAKIMQFLPLIFTFMFLNFASGLVLYWFVNNLLSILQQKLINRESEAKQAAQSA